MSDTVRAGGERAADAGARVAGRLVSLDAYRGLIMLFMVSSGFGFAQVAARFPDTAFWGFLGYHTSHVAWVGGSAWDMIQPSFMFMVGVALPFSRARRRSEGQAFAAQILHAAWRALVLVALGIFLASRGKSQTEFLFTNVLAQIGLGYLVAFALVGVGVRVQLAVIGGILVGYWLAFALHPVPAQGIDLARYGIGSGEAGEVVLPGFFAHWSKNTNFAAGFDRWFLNLFPREKEFVFQGGGYATLNFVPSIVTMVLGVMAGEVLRSGAGARRRLVLLFGAGAACMILGQAAGGWACPIVKRIWTPSWALWSGGVTLWILGAFHWIVDVRGARRWTYPLVVVGMNSIAIYLMHSLLAGWIVATLKVHLGRGPFAGAYGPVIERVSVLLILWLVCWWMYRRKIFLRI